MTESRDALGTEITCHVIGTEKKVLIKRLLQHGKAKSIN